MASNFETKLEQLPLFEASTLVIVTTHWNFHNNQYFQVRSENSSSARMSLTSSALFDLMYKYVCCVCFCVCVFFSELLHSVYLSIRMPCLILYMVHYNNTPPPPTPHPPPPNLSPCSIASFVKRSSNSLSFKPDIWRRDSTKAGGSF